MSTPSTVASDAGDRARPCTLSTSASVNAVSLNGCSQLSNVNCSHVVLNLPLGLLKVNTTIVTSGTNR